MVDVSMHEPIGPTMAKQPNPKMFCFLNLNRSHSWVNLGHFFSIFKFQRHTTCTNGFEYVISSRFMAKQLKSLQLFSQDVIFLGFFSCHGRVVMMWFLMIAELASSPTHCEIDPETDS